MREIPSRQNLTEELSIFDHLTRIPRYLAMFLIRSYQKFISPFLMPRCRFYPTCSQYCLEVYKTQSFLKATYYAIKRISNCHPGHPGGIDEPPKNCCSKHR